MLMLQCVLFICVTEQPVQCIFSYSRYFPIPIPNEQAWHGTYTRKKPGEEPDSKENYVVELHFYLFPFYNCE